MDIEISQITKNLRMSQKTLTVPTKNLPISTYPPEAGEKVACTFRLSNIAMILQRSQKESEKLIAEITYATGESAKLWLTDRKAEPDTTLMKVISVISELTGQKFHSIGQQSVNLAVVQGFHTSQDIGAANNIATTMELFLRGGASCRIENADSKVADTIKEQAGSFFELPFKGNGCDHSLNLKPNIIAVGHNNFAIDVLPEGAQRQFHIFTFDDESAGELVNNIVEIANPKLDNVAVANGVHLHYRSKTIQSSCLIDDRWKIAFADMAGGRAELEFNIPPEHAERARENVTNFMRQLDAQQDYSC